MSSIKAIVFDFDGVVLESADVKTDAFVELYREHGDSITDGVRAHHLANMGVSRFKKFEWIAKNLLHTELTDADSQRLGQRFSDLALKKVLSAPFVPGAREAIEQLAARYPLFVASGTPDAELKSIVEHRGLTKWFREVHGTPPDKPTILRDLMARHGLEAPEMLFIGDGVSDYQAATLVGTAFLARDTPALRDQWRNAGARCVPDLETLVATVDAW